MAALALIASMTNALQARVNGAASDQVGNPAIAAMMSVGGGLCVAIVIVLLIPTIRARLVILWKHKSSIKLSPWQYFAGFGGGIFILGQALIVPVFGVAIYIIAVVAGQTIASLLVDHFGIGPAGKKRVTALRTLAALLATIGVVVSATGKAEASALIIPAVLYGFAAGVATAVQYALNGKLALEFQSTLITSSLNFLMGFSLLSVVLLIALGTGVWKLDSPPSLIEQPWLWLGGVLGLIFIASAAFFVKRLGILLFAVVSVLGQLFGALLLDVFFPTSGNSVTVFMLIGLGITVIGVLAATMSTNPPKSS